MGRKELVLTQPAGMCLRSVLRVTTKVILKKVKLKVRSQRFIIDKSQACREDIFWVLLHVDIDSDIHLTL